MLATVVFSAAIATTSQNFQYGFLTTNHKNYLLRGNHPSLSLKHEENDKDSSETEKGKFGKFQVTLDSNNATDMENARPLGPYFPTRADCNDMPESFLPHMLGLLIDRTACAK